MRGRLVITMFVAATVAPNVVDPDLAHARPTCGGKPATIVGGKGRDLLKAKDGRRDRHLDCGPGTDYVKRDGFDPAPKDCGLSKKDLREQRREELREKR